MFHSANLSFFIKSCVLLIEFISGDALICVRKTGGYILGARESPATEFGSGSALICVCRSLGAWAQWVLICMGSDLFIQYASDPYGSVWLNYDWILYLLTRLCLESFTHSQRLNVMSNPSNWLNVMSNVRICDIICWYNLFMLVFCIVTLSVAAFDSWIFCLMQILTGMEMK